MLTIETTKGTYKGKNVLTIIERVFGKGAGLHKVIGNERFSAQVLDADGFITGILVYSHEDISIMGNYEEAHEARDYQKHLNSFN